MRGLQRITEISVIAGLVSALVLDVSVAVSNPADQTKVYRDQVTALREDIREVKIVGELSVNTGKKFRLVFPDKCEKEGEFELHRLTSSAVVEESYIFIPDLCLWIEVGYNEKRNRVRLDSVFIDNVLEQYHSLIFYHIHVGERLGFENYFPAYKDLVTLALINTDSISNSHIQIKHRVVTRLGIFEYKFSNEENVRKFMVKYRKIGLIGFEAQNLAYEFKRKKYKKNYYSKIRRCKSISGTFQRKINECFPLNTEALTLKFRTMDVNIE